MKNKRGISPLLSAVILVAFVVTLGAVVSSYFIKQAKEFDPNLIAEESVYCDSVGLGYDVLDRANFNTHQEGGIDPVTMDPATPGSGRPINFGPNPSPTRRLLSPLTLINKGTFSIHKLIITAPGAGSVTYQIVDSSGATPTLSSISPGQNNKYNISIDLNTGFNDDEIKIIPIINDTEKSQFIRCVNRQIVINYTQLCLDVRGPPGCT
ncbi:hypothetical protein J4216_02935 [Candidatus Woesearchaeota archaeon]|nr:hypothetical protein [Candidatus Woesearchaeota archaeon]